MTCKDMEEMVETTLEATFFFFFSGKSINGHSFQTPVI